MYVSSVTDLRLAEFKKRYDIEKLNIAINNVYNFIHYYTEDYDNVLSNGININK